MLINFIISNLNTIILLVWLIFLIIVAIKYFKSNSIKNITYLNLLFFAIGINVFYGILVSWGQYYVWSNGSEMTKILLQLPLPSQAPLPNVIEWIRPFFNNSFGYFLYYILGRVWLNILISFLISGLLYLVFKIWNHYRRGFAEDGPLLLLILMLTAGFPGVLVCVVLGFILSVLFFVISYIKGNRVLKIEPVFILSTFLSLLFTNIILLHVL